MQVYQLRSCPVIKYEHIRKLENVLPVQPGKICFQFSLGLSEPTGKVIPTSRPDPSLP